MADFALSYADIHCADLYYDSGQIYLRGIEDKYGISTKTKRDLKTENFLPLHSYMFHTGRIKQSTLRYDETLERLEDYDVLLSVARNHAFSGLYRDKLIGLYNFYTTGKGGMNTTQNVFDPTSDPCSREPWDKAIRSVLSRHAGLPWLEFFGEEIKL